MRVVQLTALNGLEVGADALSRRQAGGVLLERRARGQLRHLREDRRIIRGAPADDRSPLQIRCRSGLPMGNKSPFSRDHPGGGTIVHSVVPTGGGERKLSDFRIGGGISARIAWSPDGRAIVGRPDFAEDVARKGLWSLYLIPLGGGAPRRLTGAKAPDMDMAPAFSPDGRSLAYASCAKLTRRVCDIRVVDLDAGYTPIGPARRLVNAGQQVTAVAWTRDGRSIVYDTNGRGRWELWRVSRDGGAEAERLELAGDHSRSPAIATADDRLVFERLHDGFSVFRLRDNGPPEPMLVSSAWDYNPRFSPDGRRIAFNSRRSGDTDEIWVASADGSGARQLTTGPGSRQSLPAWSPDGHHIAFESRGADGRSHIWVIPADGGVPRRATTDAGEENAPLWSRDGTRIYFLSDRGGQGLWGGHDAWQVPAAGGPAERVTERGSAPVMYESADGTELIYQSRRDLRIHKRESVHLSNFGDGPLRPFRSLEDPRVNFCPASDGSASPSLSSGMYYSPCGDRHHRNQTNGFLQTWLPGAEIPIHVLDPSTGRTRVLGRVEPPFDSARLAVSPDGKHDPGPAHHCDIRFDGDREFSIARPVDRSPGVPPHLQQRFSTRYVICLLDGGFSPSPSECSIS